LYFVDKCNEAIEELFHNYKIYEIQH
jgi:hypothetical protein